MNNQEQKFIRVIDTTLRDGMHSVAHQFTLDQIQSIARAMNAAGVDTIEVSHGDDLGGFSIQYGRAAFSDEEYSRAVNSVLTRSKLAVLLLPGIGTRDDLDMAVGYGVKVARIATHVTEADISEQHIMMAKDRGLEVLCFLMMAHMVPVDVMMHNARLMESYGADGVYVVDSAGYMLPSVVGEQISAMKADMHCKVGFHAHNNLGAAIANSLEAIKAGADIIDGSLRSFGAGGGNAPTETLIAVLTRMGIETGVELFKIMDAAKLLDPLKGQLNPDLDAQLMLGYADVYSSFLLHTERAAKRFNVDSREILVELGRRKVVGGQEDMIIEMAYELARKHKG
jgi:4-hydroxy 2-oxovalerate aldolase